MRMKVTAAVGSVAAVLDSPGGEVLRGAAEGVTAGATMYPKTLGLDLAVHAVGVTSPEGTFLRSGAQLQHPASSAHHRAPGAHTMLMGWGATFGASLPLPLQLYDNHSHGCRHLLHERDHSLMPLA